jgi:hypothetical protein
MTYSSSAAADYAKAHARPQSHGECAKYVRRAIEYAGAHLAHTLDAKDMGTILLDGGFDEAMGPLQKGDVVIIQPAPGHPHGHAAIFDGENWISDFKQLHGLYPGPAYRQAKPSYKIYRHN